MKKVSEQEMLFAGEIYGQLDLYRQIAGISFIAAVNEATEYWLKHSAGQRVRFAVIRPRNQPIPAGTLAAMERFLAPYAADLEDDDELLERYGQAPAEQNRKADVLPFKSPAGQSEGVYD